jgi:TonB family protein
MHRDVKRVSFVDIHAFLNPQVVGTPTDVLVDDPFAEIENSGQGAGQMKTLRDGTLFLALTISACVAQVGAAQKIGSGATFAGAAQDSAPAKLSVHLLSEVPTADVSAIDHYMPAMIKRTREEWMRVFPSEARSPTLKQGTVTIEFVLRADGKVTYMTLAHASGDVVLDRAAWGAIISAGYPAFPEGMSVPQIKMQFRFSYNEGAIKDKSS